MKSPCSGRDADIFVGGRYRFSLRASEWRILRRLRMTSHAKSARKHSARCELALAPDRRRVTSVEVVGHPIGDEWAIRVGHVVDDVVAIFVHLEAFVR